MNKKVVEIGLMVLIFIGTIAILYLTTPKYEIITKRQNVFVVDKPFVEVRSSLAGAQLMKEILKANNARVVSQEVVDSDFDLRYPLRKERYWRYNSTISAGVWFRGNGFLVQSSRADLTQHLDVDKNGITADVSLDRPMSVGITDLRNHIEIEPHPDNPNQTIVRSYFYLKLERRIPGFMRPYAHKQMNLRADNSVAVFEKTFRQVTNKPSKFPFLRLLPKGMSCN